VGNINKSEFTKITIPNPQKMLTSKTHNRKRRENPQIEIEKNIAPRVNGNKTTIK
jgi:hypothetical protein